MSNENPTPTVEESQPDLAKARNEVNTLLHQLEGMVDAPQHQFLTDFLMEWSVLSAMRTTLAVQNKATAGASTGQAETKNEESAAATDTATESSKSEENNQGTESGKGE